MENSVSPQSMRKLTKWKKLCQYVAQAHEASAFICKTVTVSVVCVGVACVRTRSVSFYPTNTRMSVRRYSRTLHNV